MGKENRPARRIIRCTIVMPQSSFLHSISAITSRTTLADPLRKACCPWSFPTFRGRPTLRAAFPQLSRRWRNRGCRTARARMVSRPALLRRLARRERLSLVAQAVQRVEGADEQTVAAGEGRVGQVPGPMARMRRVGLPELPEDVAVEVKGMDRAPAPLTDPGPSLQQLDRLCHTTPCHNGRRRGLNALRQDDRDLFGAALLGNMPSKASATPTSPTTLVTPKATTARKTDATPPASPAASSSSALTSSSPASLAPDAAASPCAAPSSWAAPYACARSSPLSSSAPQASVASTLKLRVAAPRGVGRTGIPACPGRQECLPYRSVSTPSRRINSDRTLAQPLAATNGEPRTGVG